jgi:hypothetical protein
MLESIQSPEPAQGMKLASLSAGEEIREKLLRRSRLKADNWRATGRVELPSRCRWLDCPEDKLISIGASGLRAQLLTGRGPRFDTLASPAACGVSRIERSPTTPFPPATPQRASAALGIARRG